MKIALNSYSIRNEWDELKRDKTDILVDLCKDMDIKRVELLDRDVETNNINNQYKKFEDNGIEIFALAPHVKVLVKQNELEKFLNDAKYWMKLAHSVGIKKLRFQVGDGPLPRAFLPMDDFDDEEWDDYFEQMDDAINFTAPMIDPLLPIAEDLDVKIGLETHHSYSSNYVYMKKFNERWQSKHVGWIFDIGNYESDSMRWKGLEEIKNRTIYIHAKSYDYDENGFETQIDYPRACKILKDAGFDEEWSIEFEGKSNGILGAYRTNELVKYSIAKANNSSYDMRVNFPPVNEIMQKFSK